jgi:hypothetical protein
MKRLTLLAAALVMVLGFAVSASAAPEVTVSGNILINAVWQDNWGFNSDDSYAGNSTDDTFRIRERFDLAFTAVANENLKAVIVLRSTREEFGDDGYEAGSTGGGGSGDVANSVQLGVNQAYIDFNWPGTPVNVKAGYMPVALPASVGGGSLILDDVATGVLTTTAFNDNVALLAGWLRLAEAGAGNNDAAADVYADAWVVALPLSFEGVSLSPFVVIAGIGDNTTAADVLGWNNNGDMDNGLAAANAAGGDEIDGAWWAGTNFELSMLDPFIIKADLNYGTVRSNNDTGDRAGWLFDIALQYTGFDFMNLELAYAYTSGLDDDGQDDGRMPTLIDSWALGSFWFGSGLLTGDDLGSPDNIGFHAFALSATGIQSFVEGLTHDAHIVYAIGTNDEETGPAGTAAAARGITYGNSLTEDDSMLELDFNTFYKIYDELTLYNGIGYINLDADEDVWGNGAGGDAWKFQLGLKYSF